MTTLHLGVHDISYAAGFHAPEAARLAKKGRTLSKAQRAYGAGKTTGDIAEILEGKYKLMQAFYEMEKTKVVIPAIQQSMQRSLTTMMMGQHPGPIDPHARGMFAIATAFKHNLSQRRYDGKIPGVPTYASNRFKEGLGGISHRFARPYAKHPARPSFIDTGTYQSSFVAWIDEATS